MFNDLKTRGVADILIAVTNGLKGIGEALGAVFPAGSTLQTCIVHLIRNSLDFAAGGASSWPRRSSRSTAPSAEAAAVELDGFERSPWGQKYPTVTAAWRRAWDPVIPFAFPTQVLVE